jgi:PPOX class probable F420-dependent enzyme
MAERGSAFGLSISIPANKERIRLDVDAAVEEYLTGHQWAVLATGRKDGSPQSSMIAYVWDGEHVLMTFRQHSAKRHNIARQPRVALLVPDGRRALTIYGTAELLEADPERVDAYAAILAGFGVSPVPDDIATQMDEEGRVAARIRPEQLDLHD